MFADLHRWKRKPGTEQTFREAWSSATAAVAARSGTGGSRVHRTDDGEFPAYAVWPRRQSWEDASHLPSASPEAGAKTRACIEQSVSTTPLDVLDDFRRELP